MVILKGLDGYFNKKLNCPKITLKWIWVKTFASVTVYIGLGIKFQSGL